ncbi:hypothetical protein [Carp edema virus]|nr:hypothetical protein [Carp edema virus]
MAAWRAITETCVKCLAALSSHEIQQELGVKLGIYNGFIQVNNSEDPKDNLPKYSILTQFNNMSKEEKREYFDWVNLNISI